MCSNSNMLSAIVMESLHAIDWQRSGYFFTFQQVLSTDPDGTLILNTDTGTFRVDHQMQPAERISYQCNRLIRMGYHNAQLLAVLLQSRTPVVLTDPADLWMVPLIVGFGRDYMLSGFTCDLVPFIKAGEILRCFFVPLERDVLADFQTFTMEQQELVYFLYYNYGFIHGARVHMERPSEDLWAYFKGMLFDHIFEAFNWDYARLLRAVVEHYRRKGGQRLAYAAFFHGLDRAGVPASEFRRCIGHGSGRFPIRKRVCAFLFTPLS